MDDMVYIKEKLDTIVTNQELMTTSMKLYADRIVIIEKDYAVHCAECEARKRQTDNNINNIYTTLRAMKSRPIAFIKDLALILSVIISLSVLYTLVSNNIKANNAQQQTNQIKKQEIK
jgi:hypothetical protein